MEEDPRDTLCGPIPTTFSLTLPDFQSLGSDAATRDRRVQKSLLDTNQRRVDSGRLRGGYDPTMNSSFYDSSMDVILRFSWP